MTPITKEQRLRYLFHQYTAQQCSEQELRQLADYAEDEELRFIWQQLLDEVTVDGSTEALYALHAPVIDQVYNNIIKQYKQPATKLRFLQSTWKRYIAAAILILSIGSGVYYFNNHHSKSGKSGESGFKTMVRDIAPGTNRAILTINNNQKIDLATNKTCINVSNAITYNDGEKIADAGQMLQLTTPRGGQYQAVLPDGSRVWLNAASSIKFPSKFTGKERCVEITGEAYFEIEKDATKPFKVYGGGQEIEVLGTSFNINIYNDEPIKKTTLLTGSIKITSNNQTAILQPGQQAEIPITPITKIKQITVQTDDPTAWLHNRFSFNEKTDLSSLLRQIARWYDVDIINKTTGPQQFWGSISRQATITEVMQKLELTGRLKCSIEGRTITITSK